LIGKRACAARFAVFFRPAVAAHHARKAGGVVVFALGAVRTIRLRDPRGEVVVHVLAETARDAVVYARSLLQLVVHPSNARFAVLLSPSVAADHARKAGGVVVFALGAIRTIRLRDPRGEIIVHVLAETARYAGGRVRLLLQRVVPSRDTSLAPRFCRALGLVGVLALDAYFAKWLLDLLVVATQRAYPAVAFLVALVFVVVFPYGAVLANKGGDNISVVPPRTLVAIIEGIMFDLVRPFAQALEIAAASCT
jgi:hypothetical protein